MIEVRILAGSWFTGMLFSLYGVTMKKEDDRRKFFTGVAILIGTVIGAGFLGIPSLVSKSGYVIGVFYLILLGLVIYVLNLALGEVTLRTKGNRQLTGYAYKYLGKNGKIIMFAALLFEVYSAVIAYLLGMSKSLSFIMFGEIQNVLAFGIAIWFLMSLLVYGGLKKFKIWIDYGSLTILILIVLIAIINMGDIRTENLSSIYLDNFFAPFGVVMFAFLGFTAIPEITRHFYGREKMIKNVLFLGMLIPFIVYLIYVTVMVGVYGEGVAEVSTISLGSVVVLLGIITMGTSYIALSMALRDTFMLDYNKKSGHAWLLTCFVPLVLFVFLNLIGFDSFTKILSLGGAVAGGLIGLLIIFMFLNAKEKGNRKPEYEIKIPYWQLVLIVLIFFIGVVYEFFNSLFIG